MCFNKIIIIFYENYYHKQLFKNTLNLKTIQLSYTKPNNIFILTFYGYIYALHKLSLSSLIRVSWKKTVVLNSVCTKTKNLISHMYKIFKTNISSFNTKICHKMFFVSI